MPALENERRELFAQNLASGLLECEAYERAGFKPDTGNASHLRAKPEITERVQEIMDAAFKACDLNPEWTTRRLMAMAEDAGDKGQHKTNQNRALESLCKILGQYKADEKPPEGQRASVIDQLKSANIPEAVKAMLIEALGGTTETGDERPAS